MIESGRVSWASVAEASPTTKDKEAKPFPVIDMKGNNKTWKLRVLDSAPLSYRCHFVLDKNGKNTKVNCTLDDTCPVQVEKTKSLCGGLQGDRRFYLKVLDRATNLIQVIDVGPQIINGIGQLIENSDWGPCSEYDISLKKGAQGANPLYTVSPSPKKPLTEEDLALLAASEDPEHADFIDLESRAKPLAADVINKIMKGGESIQASLAPKRPQSTPSPKGSIVVGKPQIQTQQVTPPSEEEFDINWDE